MCRICLSGDMGGESAKSDESMHIESSMTLSLSEFNFVGKEMAFTIHKVPLFSN